MKNVKELFEELGFKKEAPDGVKKAFIKNLIYAANDQCGGAKVLHLPESKSEKPVIAGEQLTFDIESVK